MWVQVQLSEADIETIGKFVQEGFLQMSNVKEQLEQIIKDNNVILFMKGDRITQDVVSCSK